MERVMMLSVAASRMKHAKTETKLLGLQLDRVARGHRYYQYSREFVTSHTIQGKSCGATHGVFEQPKTG